MAYRLWDICFEQIVKYVALRGMYFYLFMMILLTIFCFRKKIADHWVGIFWISVLVLIIIFWGQWTVWLIVGWLVATVVWSFFLLRNKKVFKT